MILGDGWWSRRPAPGDDTAASGRGAAHDHPTTGEERQGAQMVGAG